MNCLRKNQLSYMRGPTSGLGSTDLYIVCFDILPHSRDGRNFMTISFEIR